MLVIDLVVDVVVLVEVDAGLAVEVFDITDDVGLAVDVVVLVDVMVRLVVEVVVLVDVDVGVRVETVVLISDPFLVKEQLSPSKFDVHRQT